MRLVTLSKVREAPKTQSSMLVTVGGTIYAGVEVRSVDKQTVRFSRGDRMDLSIPSEQVARIYLPGLTQETIDHLPTTGTGVLLTNGDFYEGDIDQLQDGKVQVNSVIFGPRQFTLRSEVSALVLRPTGDETQASNFVVEGNDGSVFRADALAADGQNLVVADQFLGKLSLDFRSLREIRYGGDRLKQLADLRPRRVDPSPSRPAAEGFFIDRTRFGPMLQLSTVDFDHGVSLAAGASVTYDLDGQYKTLLCVAGVPAEMLPTSAAVFVAEADGKELFRSPPRTSIDDGLPVSIDVTGLKTVTLRVEAEKGNPLPVVGLWGDPQLVKTK
jgi:hypothetical protein